MEPQGEADGEGPCGTEGVPVVSLFGSICGPAVDGIDLERKNSVFLLRDGGNSKEVVSVELDEGAKGLGGSWVDSDLVKRLGLRVRPCRDVVRFGSRLFPELEYIPVEEVDLRLEFCPAGVSVTLPCFVLPPSRAGIERKSDVIIGDYHLMTYGIRELMQLREPVFKPAAAAIEVKESLKKQLDEGAILENLNLFGAFSAVGAEIPVDSWGLQVCTKNFPVGSIERDRVVALLEEFRGAVIVDTLDGTKAKVPAMQVDLKPGSTYEGVKARRYSPEKQKVIRAWLDKMLAQGLIQKSSSTTSSPLLVVQDPSGKWRVTQDVTVLNSMMKTLNGSIPDIKCLLERFKGMKYLSCLDLVAAYHQLPAHEQMRKLWAFSTPWGVYEYCDRLPMGDKNVCVWFNDQMLKMMDGIDNVAVYFDDLPFGANSVDELLSTLRKVLERLREYNVKISLAKLRIGYSELDILGYDLTAVGYRPRERNVKKFLEEPFPTTERLRHWLGLLNVFAKFIPNYAEIREPFSPALKKGGVLKDCEETRAGFEKAKQAVAGIQQLFHLDEEREIFLDTDASDYGIGACLYHRGTDGQMEPILFTAHLLSDAAKLLSTKKKEAYAIYKALEDMEYLLRGREFVLRTDHRNLLYLMSHTDAVEHRFYQFISEFAFTIEYVPGLENVVADPLSRMFSPENLNVFGGIHRELVSEYFARTHGINVGHLGINKTCEAVQEAMLRDNVKAPPNLRSEIAELIGECMVCVKARTKIEKPALFPHALHGGRFFERIQMDFLEGLPLSVEGFSAILVIVCTFSKFVMLFPVKEKTAEVAKTCLLYCMSIFGFPALSVSDGGPAFKSEELQCLCDYTGTDVLITHPHRPSAHGTVERVHQSVLKHVSHLVHQVIEAEEADWPVYVPWAQRIMNNTVNSSTRYAPVSIVFGQSHVNDSKMMEFTAKDDRMSTANWDAYVTKHNAILSALQTASNEYLDNALLERIKLMKEAEQVTELLPVGSFVLARIPAKSKLQLKWRGPYRVLEAIADNFYKLRDITQDVDLVEHRDDLWKVDCKSDAEALEYAQMDTNELTIVEVIGHMGKPEQPSTMIFKCRCKETEEVVNFAFRSCKHVGLVKDYIKGTAELKPLTASVHYSLLKARKKTKKLTSNLKGYK